MAGEIGDLEENVEQLGPLQVSEFLEVKGKFGDSQRALKQKLPYRFRGPVRGKPLFLPAPAFVKLLVASENEVPAAKTAALRRGSWLLAVLNAAAHDFCH